MVWDLLNISVESSWSFYMYFHLTLHVFLMNSSPRRCYQNCFIFFQSKHLMKQHFIQWVNPWIKCQLQKWLRFHMVETLGSLWGVVNLCLDWSEIWIWIQHLCILIWSWGTRVDSVMTQLWVTVMIHIK